MRGKPVLKKEIELIVKLRQTGHSLPEIKEIVRRGNSTVFKYAKNVEILPKFKQILKSKQGGSKRRSKKDWSIALKRAKDLLPVITRQEKLLILAALYWGEGTKSELNIINSDPELLRIFIKCLYDIGVTPDKLRVTLRIYEDTSSDKARKYWASALGVPKRNIANVNILKGKKSGKLQYGMCRVRVAKGGQYFKLIMSMIELIKFKI